MKIALRILASPFILPLLLITYSYCTVKHFVKFLRYGGELVTYQKDEPKRMKDIYEMLRKMQDEMPVK